MFHSMFLKFGVDTRGQTRLIGSGLCQQTRLSYRIGAICGWIGSLRWLQHDISWYYISSVDEHILDHILNILMNWWWSFSPWLLQHIIFILLTSTCSIHHFAVLHFWFLSAKRDIRKVSQQHAPTKNWRGIITNVLTSDLKFQVFCLQILSCKLSRCHIWCQMIRWYMPNQRVLFQREVCTTRKGSQSSLPDPSSQSCLLHIQFGNQTSLIKNHLKIIVNFCFSCPHLIYVDLSMSGGFDEPKYM